MTHGALFRGFSIRVINDLVITGTGLITPLGANVSSVWKALLVGEFIRDHARVPGLETQPARICQLALSAAKQAIAEAGWTRRLLSDPSTALVVGTSKGPIENWIGAPPVATNEFKGIVNANGYGLSELASYIANEILLGGGPRSTSSGACASALHALLNATILIRSGQANRVLVVGAEASVHPLFIGSFKRLGVLPREGIGCRPFDQARDGFLISESAAAICLERSESESKTLVNLDCIAIAGDATHLTGADSNGAALRYVLRKIIDDRSVDLIHAHATGTILNDPIELAAIEASIPRDVEQRPNVYSHKGALGHSLGAAGLVAVVLNSMSHKTGVVPPNVRTQNPIEFGKVRIDLQLIKRPISRSIAVAAGFGGAVAGVSLRGNS